MSNIETDFLSEQSREWVREVSSLQSRLSEKLIAIGFLNLGEDDPISHHLAEVSYAGSIIAGRLVPQFLKAEGTELSDVAVDLVEDLRELREAIEAMESSLLRLMNQLNPDGGLPRSGVPHRSRPASRV